MKRSHELYLHEEVLLLALRDEQGTIASGSMFTYAMGGAILAELLLRERVAVDETSRRKLVNVVDTKRTGDPVLDECLKLMREAKRRKPMQGWVTKFATTRGLRDRVALGLCRRHILKADEGRVLMLFKRKIYPECDPAPERAIVKRLRRAIFSETRDVDARTLVLVSLANSANVLSMVFEKRELRARKARLKLLASEESAGEAASAATAAIRAAQAAVAMMIVTTTVISSN